MSGPVAESDVPPAAAVPEPPGPVVEVMPGRTAFVASTPVARLLPRRARRTVGAWCFLDHFGPQELTRETTMQIGPHPHIGLQTVTWLLSGEIVHTDSLGSEQPIRPGQLNLMSAGNGVAHAEDGRGTSTGTMHGVQLWIAQPEGSRHGAAAFEHHAELPQVELHDGVATVLLGSFADLRSPARFDTPLTGVDMQLFGPCHVPLFVEYEYGVAVLEGAIDVDGTRVAANEFAYLGVGRDQMQIDASSARVLLLGGEPFPEPILMWWNFVARSRAEIDAAYADWEAHLPRFPEVATSLPRIPAPRPSWMA